MSPRSRMTRRQKLLAFGPALLIIGVTALTASGLSMVSGATAASSISVSGTVGSSVSVDPNPDVSGGGDCTAGSSTSGDMSSFGSAWANTAVIRSGCVLTYGTNHPGGAHVTFVNANTGEAAVFCNDPIETVPVANRDCASGQVDDVPSIGSDLATPGRFGIALVEAGGHAQNTAGSGVGADNGGVAPTAGDTIWAPVPASAAAELCTTGVNNDGTDSVCTIAFGVHGHGAASQPAGEYSGTVNFTIVDNS